MCSGRVGSSCSTSGIQRATLVQNSVINHESRKKNGIMITKNGIYMSHRMSVKVNRVVMAMVKTNFIIRNHWFSNFLVNSNPLSRKS